MVEKGLVVDMVVLVAGNFGVLVLSYFEIEQRGGSHSRRN